MRHYGTAKVGDVIRTYGSGNAPGAGGLISEVIVTDKKADGSHSGTGGYECRDATPEEVKSATDAGRCHTHYC